MKMKTLPLDDSLALLRRCGIEPTVTDGHLQAITLIDCNGSPFVIRKASQYSEHMAILVRETVKEKVAVLTLNGTTILDRQSFPADEEREAKRKGEEWKQAWIAKGVSEDLLNVSITDTERYAD